jgi:hypothetical protein
MRKEMRPSTLVGELYLYFYFLAIVLGHSFDLSLSLHRKRSSDLVLLWLSCR